MNTDPKRVYEKLYNEKELRALCLFMAEYCAKFEVDNEQYKEKCLRSMLLASIGKYVTFSDQYNVDSEFKPAAGVFEYIAARAAMRYGVRIIRAAYIGDLKTGSIEVSKYFDAIASWSAQS
jgi:hypothetical protein